MYFKSFKFAATLHFVILAAIGMVLIDLVVSGLWQRHLTEMRLAHTGELLRKVQQFAEYHGQRSNGSQEDMVRELHRYFPEFYFYGQGAGDSGMEIVLQRAQTTQQESRLVRGGLSSVFGISGKVVYHALPLGGYQRSAVATLVEIPGISLQLLLRQKIIFLYIGVNLLILTVLWYLRIRDLILEPLQSLVLLTENSALISFEELPLLQQKNAFAYLADAIRKMIRKIEEDRQRLRLNVASLEAANSKILENQKKLVEAEKFAALGKLSAGLAHEIGNPLGIIQGYVELLSLEETADEQRQDYAKRATSELDRVNRLIGQLLDISRKRADGGGETEICRLLSEMEEMLRHQWEKRNVTSSLRCDLVTSCSVRYREDALRQVLLNCFLNAQDAIEETGRGGGNILISCEKGEGDRQKMLRLVIEDDGIGVTSEVLPNIFDFFYTTKDTGKGTGLGLSVSRFIIESEGGSIELEAVDDGGSRVILWLPLVNYSDDSSVSNREG